MNGDDIQFFQYSQEQSAEVFCGKVQSFWSEKKQKCQSHFNLHFYTKDCLIQISFSRAVDQASCLQVVELRVTKDHISCYTTGFAS
jgi:hypothetical protein